MDMLAVIRFDDEIRSTSFSADALQEAATSLAGISSDVDARRICRAMSETWGVDVLPLARELLASKKAGERARGLELFAHIPDATLIPELEAAKERDRSKKLHGAYDFAVRRIRKAVERDNPAADPLDTTADPLARMRVLANLPYEQLWKLTGIRERYWGHIELPAEGGDDKRLRRLTGFLRSGQTQPYWLAQLLYIAHPAAGVSATQLVWQAKVDGGWVSFRGTPGGGACDAAGTELAIDGTADIRLAHPIELDEEPRTAWSALAAAEGWSYALGQLEAPCYTKKDVTLVAAVEGTPPLDERKMKTWLAAQGLEPIWVHEHRQPHALEHVLTTDDDRTWLRLKHDAIVARRTGRAPIRIKGLEVKGSTKRRHSEAVRLLRELGEHAAAS